ncbi:MAG TPA: hypothetical protein VII47_04795 [Actinomycetota bacterium]
MSRASAYVEVWDEGGAWHWQYRDPDEDVVLLGNRTYPAKQAAVAAARRAYPGMRIRDSAAGTEHLAARAIGATALGALGAGATLFIRRRLNRWGGRRMSPPGKPARRARDGS